MFSGFQEILLIGLIIAGILVLPRMIKPQPLPQARPRRPVLRLTWAVRLFIVLTILWPVSWAFYFEPWHQPNTDRFTLVGLGPVVVGWCLKWIIAGMTNKRRC